MPGGSVSTKTLWNVHLKVTVPVHIRYYFCMVTSGANTNYNFYDEALVTLNNFRSLAA